MKMKLQVKGYELVKARYFKGLSIQDVADGTGLSTKTICDTENEKSAPTPKTLKLLCDFLNIDPEKVVS